MSHAISWTKLVLEANKFTDDKDLGKRVRFIKQTAATSAKNKLTNNKDGKCKCNFMVQIQTLVSIFYSAIKIF